EGGGRTGAGALAGGARPPATSGGGRARARSAALRSRRRRDWEVYGPSLLQLADDPHDLDGLGTQLGSQLVLDRLGGGDEPGLVHLFYGLDPDLLEPLGRLLLEREGVRRLQPSHLGGRRLVRVLLLGGGDSRRRT